jgi:hypothetical protein
MVVPPQIKMEPFHYTYEGRGSGKILRDISKKIIE